MMKRASGAASERSATPPPTHPPTHLLEYSVVPSQSVSQSVIHLLNQSIKSPCQRVDARARSSSSSEWEGGSERVSE